MNHKEHRAPNENVTGSQKDENVQAASCYVRITEQMQGSLSGNIPQKSKAHTPFIAERDVRWPASNTAGAKDS